MNGSVKARGDLTVMDGELDVCPREEWHVVGWTAIVTLARGEFVGHNVQLRLNWQILWCLLGVLMTLNVLERVIAKALQSFESAQAHVGISGRQVS